MSNYNYLKIDFYGQFNADTIHKLTYPEPYNPMGSASQLWLNPITDPRVIRTLFPMAKYGYRVHRDANGTYYSLLTRYERDARQGYVAITVMIGAKYESLINGKAIFNLLNMLKANVLDTDNITSRAVEQCLIASQMPTINASPMRITQVQNRSQQAFRVYNTNEELYDIFQFPKQAEYDQYGEVFLINKFWCNNTVPGVALLTSSIIKTYSVTKTDNVKCDSTTQTGKTLNITYNKPGFAPYTIPLTINGINNQYVRYDGANITILTPDDLPFMQRMNVRVKINGYSYSDSTVKAAVGGAPMHYSAQLSAYTADVSKEALSEADIKVSVNIDDPLLDPTGESQRKAAIYKWLAPIIAFLLGAAIAAGVTWFLMKGNDSESTDNKPTTEEVTDSATIAKQELDIKYMKEKNTWVIDSIKSDKYRHFAMAITNGDVQEVVKMVGEMQKDSLPINGYLTQIVEKIKQNPETAKGILKNPDQKGKTIDLEKINKELSTKINSSTPDPSSDVMMRGSNGGANDDVRPRGNNSTSDSDVRPRGNNRTGDSDVRPRGNGEDNVDRQPKSKDMFN
ncbi:MAG: hypothetical protein IKW83_11490 [Muribaculaceae bacterium]|nr:hypothetical protein [Muribaculaceae bacterium]